MADIEKIKEELLAPKTVKTKNWKKGLSSGSTLLNLACSNRPHVAFLPGYYYWLIGHSDSGKTFLTMTCLAEATKNPHYDDYRFIYDGTENGLGMDVEKFFGKEVGNRLEAPSYDEDKTPVYSESLEHFYYHLDDACSQGPCIYILDSMDAIEPKEDQEKFDENKEAFKKGKDAKGSYGMAKAKMNSSYVRRARNNVEKSNSILIVISQARANVGFGFTEDTVAGGKSLKFYAETQIWAKPKGDITTTKTKNGRKKTIQQGITAQLQVKKNRGTGQKWNIEIDIYHSYGIDDIGGMVKYLLEEDHWEKTTKKITFPEFNFTGTSQELIKHIEENNQERKLRELVGQVWNEIVEASKINRKKRYE